MKIADEPEAWTHENFPFAALHNLTIKGVPALALRISYVGEQGWELHFKYEEGLALWDALHACRSGARTAERIAREAKPYGVMVAANCFRRCPSARASASNWLQSSGGWPLSSILRNTR